jgi:choline dehydrogenase-like flavoprotein
VSCSVNPGPFHEIKVLHRRSAEEREASKDPAEHRCLEAEPSPSQTAQSRLGFGYYDFAIGNGVRSSASRYLQSLLKERVVGSSVASKSSDVLTRRDTYNTRNGGEARTKVGSVSIELNANVDTVILSSLAAEQEQGAAYALRTNTVTSAAVDAMELSFYKASGVSYSQTTYAEGTARTVSKEALLRSNSVQSQRCVILAGGAVQTPKLLMNSGIGPADVLAEAGVGVLLDSREVGKHLRDHPMVGIIMSTKPQLTVGKAILGLHLGFACGHCRLGTPY